MSSTIEMRQDTLDIKSMFKQGIITVSYYSRLKHTLMYTRHKSTYTLESWGMIERRQRNFYEPYTPSNSPQSFISFLMKIVCNSLDPEETWRGRNIESTQTGRLLETRQLPHEWVSPGGWEEGGVWVACVVSRQGDGVPGRVSPRVIVLNISDIIIINVHVQLSPTFRIVVSLRVDWQMLTECFSISSNDAGGCPWPQCLGSSREGWRWGPGWRGAPPSRGQTSGTRGSSCRRGRRWWWGRWCRAEGWWPAGPWRLSSSKKIMTLKDK